MKFKVSNKKSLIIGAILIVISSSYIIIDRYYNFKESNVGKEVLKKWELSITPDKVKEDKKSETSFVEMITENQELEEVTSMVNCISIPELKILAKVNEGITSDALHTGVGHFDNTANIGEAGNFCIAGHASDTYNCVFNKLNEINKYDTIDVYDKSGRKYEYTVINTFVVQSDYTDVLDYDSSSDERFMTIVTCTDRGQRRFIVVAKILSEDEIVALRESERNEILDTASQYNNIINVPEMYDYFTN